MIKRRENAMEVARAGRGGSMISWPDRSVETGSAFIRDLGECLPLLDRSMAGCSVAPVHGSSDFVSFTPLLRHCDRRRRRSSS